MILLIDLDRERTVGDGQRSPGIYIPYAATCAVNGETANTTTATMAL